MFLRFGNIDRFLDLHLTTGLTDWDINEEINLTTTTDQYHQDGQRNEYLIQWHYARMSRRTSTAEIPCQYSKQSDENDIEPNLWLIVNPNLVCPMHPSRLTPTKAYVGTPNLDHQFINTHLPYEPLTPVSPEVLDKSPSDTFFTSKHMVSDDESSAELEICRKMKVTRQSRVPKEGERACRTGQTRGRGRGRPPRRVHKDSDSFAFRSWAWPRPPVNYCLLIAMALGSCRTGSLNVQQIYSFTREHFPFFQTAPDGWKNTIRHNLCFSTSFKKTPQQVSSGGERKSCLWHLTSDGRMRHRSEIQMLSDDAIKQLTRSMKYPDLIQELLDL
ncbi:hypothetical protein AALO_G00083160 [Alosa alosa]|uniref:Fork-head domain-containing protein n=1 Tax=Alosa alosa TaxID=278164 RepID=A0AAV6H1M8_9TELE|nr:forkhead box protein R1 isoform X1 [Alosa alosa]KAG5279935.1 hypothetical protein AALO_G00083160 [Alosa alosa]